MVESDLISNHANHHATHMFYLINHPLRALQLGGLHLLDFGCLRDALQILLEQQDFGVFLLQNGDQVVQQSDVPVTTPEKYRGQH